MAATIKKPKPQRFRSVTKHVRICRLQNTGAEPGFRLIACNGEGFADFGAIIAEDALCAIEGNIRISDEPFFVTVPENLIKRMIDVSLDAMTCGGVDIILPNANDTDLDRAYLVSGNTYTLLATGDWLNYSAVYAETDSLTWTSSNKKVATVKATKGSVSATLKALKAGTTTIEVKSKITKAVIARYVIEIKAVGNAYNYYGENESDYNAPVTEDDAAMRLTLNSGLRVSTNAGEYQWIRFTAPSTGNYTFYSAGSSDTKAWFFHDMSIGDHATSDSLDDSAFARDDDSGENNNFSITISLQEGETVYIAVGYYCLTDPISTTVYAIRAD